MLTLYIPFLTSAIKSFLTSAAENVALSAVLGEEIGEMGWTIDGHKSIVSTFCLNVPAATWISYTLPQPYEVTKGVFFAGNINGRCHKLVI